MTIKALREATRGEVFYKATIEGQVEALSCKETSSGKPFFEVILRDATDTLTLRAWSDKPSYKACQQFKAGDFVCIEGTFSQGAFGLDAPGWTIEALSNEQISLLLEGPLEQQVANEASYQVILDAVVAITDPRLKALCESFLSQYGPRFRRAAAARSNHHARRGGLLDHTSRMMQSMLALLPVYQNLNADLLVAGILFHDSGKLWETCPPARGFEMVPELRGELMGHLSIGIELVNALWRELPKDDWVELLPPSEEVRLHLLHLIGAHHGQLEYGSPILPKTPEAILLHLVDNLDARLEMFHEAYARAKEISPGIFEWVRPLGVSPVASLSPYTRLEERVDEV